METMCVSGGAEARERQLASQLGDVSRLQGAARLEALWAMSQPLVVIAGRRRHLSPEAIEDASQEWYLALAQWDAASQLPITSLHALRAAIGRFLERRQRMERARLRADQTPFPHSAAPADTLRIAALWEYIETLPSETYRAILRFAAEVSGKPADLAEYLGITPARARKRLCRARRALRKYVAEHPSLFLDER